MTVTVPVVTAATNPVAAPITATAVLLQVHTPPVTISLNEVVLQSSVAPDMGAGCIFTVTITAAIQPPPVV